MRRTIPVAFISKTPFSVVSYVCLAKDSMHNIPLMIRCRPWRYLEITKRRWDFQRRDTRQANKIKITLQFELFYRDCLNLKQPSFGQGRCLHTGARRSLTRKILGVNGIDGGKIFHIR